MKTNKKEIGARIKKARIESGMQQNDLALMTGLAQSTLSEIINGNRVTSVENLARISIALGLSLDYLITGKERPPKTPQPTKEDALRLILTSDPALVESIKAELRSQIREETPAYNGLTKDEQQLLNEYRLLDERRKERLIETAIDMSTALLRGPDQEAKGGGNNCAESNGK